MAKFVEVHSFGKKILLNIDKVDCFFPDGSGIRAVMYDGNQKLDESYDEIRLIIGSAQGGIPMEPGRMYDGA